MMDIALAKPTPTISVDNKGAWMLVIERNSYPTVEELGQPEVRVAGMRINPIIFHQAGKNIVTILYSRISARVKSIRSADCPPACLQQRLCGMKSKIKSPSPM
jgi:hypothetical protein